MIYPLHYNIIIITSLNELLPSTAIANKLPGQLLSTHIKIIQV